MPWQRPPHHNGGMPLGAASTRLVVLRGPSASGKTTAALALRPLLGARTALIHQDYFRREILHDDDRPRRSADAAQIIIATARQALDLGYDVILDGIFNLRDYAQRLEQLAADHAGVTRVYAFDIPLDETIRRHAGRELSAQFGAEKLHDWYDGWQPLPHLAETRVTPDVTTGALVAQILRDLDGAAPA